MNGDGEQAQTGSEPQTLSTDVVFKTLSNQRRRYVLHYLKHHDTEQPVAIRTLSEQIAAWENRVDRGDVNPKQRKRIYTALHQTHLPKMDHLGIVDYDRNRGTVSLSDSVEQFDIYFEMLDTNELPWSHLYLGVGSVASALVVCAWLSIWPFGLLSGHAYALILAGTLLAIAGYHTYQDRSHVIGAGSVPPELDIPLAVPAERTETEERE